MWRHRPQRLFRHFRDAYISRQPRHVEPIGDREVCQRHQYDAQGDKTPRQHGGETHRHGSHAGRRHEYHQVRQPSPRAAPRTLRRCVRGRNDAAAEIAPIASSPSRHGKHPRQREQPVQCPRHQQISPASGRNREERQPPAKDSPSQAKPTQPGSMRPRIRRLRPLPPQRAGSSAAAATKSLRCSDVAGDVSIPIISVDHLKCRQPRVVVELSAEVFQHGADRCDPPHRGGDHPQHASQRAPPAIRPSPRGSGFRAECAPWPSPPDKAAASAAKAVRRR